MEPAAVLAVVVKARGVAATNAQISSVHSNLVKAETAGAALGSGLQKSQARMAAAGAGMSSAGRSITRNVGLPLVAVTALAGKAAIDFEDSFADIRKTVDASDRQFKVLEAGTRRLAKQIPISVNELNRLGGQAGALGIKSKDLLKFVKTAAELGTTTDLSSEEASTALAGLSNIMKTPAREFRKLASTFVDLGNKGASTEQEIASMSLRIAGAANTLGLTEAETLGLAAALSNVRIRAEMGGTAVSRIMLQMQEAIAKGGGELKNFADITGMSSDEFVRSFKDNVPATIAKFAAGIGRINKEGKPVISTLKSVELGERRVGDTILRIAGNTGQFVQAQKVANAEWRDNNALTNEARKRFGTTASKIELAKNKINDAGISLGQNLLPVIAEVLDVVGTMAHWFGVLPEGTQQWILKIAALVVVLGVLLSLLGKLVLAFAQIPKLIIWLTTAQAANTAATTAQAAANAELAVSAHAAAMAQRELLIANKSGAVVGSVPIGGPTAMTTVGGAAGKTGAARIASGLARAVPIAFAAIGLANIVSSAISGDMKAAGFKAGGALVGGIAGFLVGGPVGAMIGGGLGSVVGGMIGDLFGGGKQLHPLQEKLKAQSERVAKTFKKQRDAARSLASAQRQLAKMQDRHRQSSNRADAANRRYNRAVKQFGPASKQAHEAALRLARAQNKETRAAKAAANAHKLSRNEQKLLLLKSREVVAQEKVRIPNLKAVIRQLDAKHRKDKSNIPLLERLVNKERDLAKAQRRIGQAIRDVAAINPKQARNLRRMTTVQAEFGTKLKGLIQTLPTFKRKSVDSTTQARRGFEAMRRGIFTQTNLAKADVGSFNKATKTGIGAVRSDLKKFASQLGISSVQFGTKKKGQGKQAGGMVVPGGGTGDKVPLNAMVEPGEVVHVLNTRASKDRAKLAALERTNMEVPRFPHRQMPRFAAGGTFVDPRGPGTGVVNKAIADAVGSWSTRYNAAINYGYDPGGGHVSPGHNVTGTATDTGPAAGWAAGPTQLFETGLRAISGKVDQILYGTAGIGESYPNHGRGNHAHIEWGMHPAVQGALGSMIAQRIFTGPNGMLKTAGQASLDIAVKMANKKLQQMGGIGGGPDAYSIGGKGSMSKQQIAALWRGVNPATGDPNLMAAIALAESSGIPNNVGIDPGGTRGLGLWQITTGFNDDLIAKFGGESAMFNPKNNALAAADILRRQGLGAWVVYNTGAYQQFMQDGGLLGMQKGGSIQKGIKNTLRGMAKGKQLPKYRAMLKKVKRRIDGIGLSGARLRHLDTLTKSVERFSEYASNASSLTTQDEEGNVTQGIFKGRNEAAWLTEQLGSLMQLRSHVVSAHGSIKEKQLPRVSNLIRDTKARLRHVRKVIRRAERHKKELEKKIKDIERAHKQSKQAAEKDIKELERKLDQAQGAKKPNRQQIDALRATIKSRREGMSSGDNEVNKTVRGLNKDIRGINRQQSSRRRVESSLKDSILPALEGKRTNLGETMKSMFEDGGEARGSSFLGLKQIQGAGGTLGPIPNPPAVSEVGGELFQVLDRLRQINEEANRVNVPDPGDGGEAAELQKELTLIWKKRFMASQAQFAVLRDMPGVQQTATVPYAGAFAMGGVGGLTAMEVGERGREIVFPPRGSRVIPKHEANAALRGNGTTTLIIEELNIHEDGKVTIKPKDGPEVAAVVKSVNRKSARRSMSPTPGGK